MKVMLNRKSNATERIDNMLSGKYCPALYQATRDNSSNNLVLNTKKHEYYLEVLNIDYSTALKIILELQVNGNKLPFVCNMYKRLENKLVLEFSEECGLTMLREYSLS